MTKEYSWRSKEAEKGAQIDLLIHRKDMVINVCEMKYSSSPYVITKDYQDNLKNKLESFMLEMKPKEQLVLTLISFNGLQNNNYSDLFLKVIEGKDLFE